MLIKINVEIIELKIYGKFQNPFRLTKYSGSCRQLNRELIKIFT